MVFALAIYVVLVWLLVSDVPMFVECYVSHMCHMFGHSLAQCQAVFCVDICLHSHMFIAICGHMLST
jgi:hypothetical protein